MAGVQGKHFTVEKIARVQYLLAETELTLNQIAVRMGISTSAIISINRKSDIRRYNGKRSQWEKGADAASQAVTSQL